MPRRLSTAHDPKPDQYELVRKWIRGKIKDLGISQQQLAIWAHISEPMLSGILSDNPDTRRTPGLNSLTGIAHAFGMTVDGMFLAAGVTDKETHHARIEAYTARARAVFQQLSDDQQDEAIRLLEALARIKRPEAERIIGQDKRLPLDSPRSSSSRNSGST